MTPTARTLRITLTILLVWVPLSSCTLNNNPTIFSGYGGPYKGLNDENLSLAAMNKRLQADPDVILREHYNSLFDPNKAMPPYITLPPAAQPTDKTAKGKSKKVTRCDKFVPPDLPPEPKPTNDDLGKVGKNDANAMLLLLLAQIEKAHKHSQEVEKLMADAVEKHLKSCSGG